MPAESTPKAQAGKRGRPLAGQRFTEAEFAAVALLLRRVTSDRLKLAKLHLVDGVPQSTVANKHGCTRQNVNGAVNMVLKASQMLKEANKLAGQT